PFFGTSGDRFSAEFKTSLPQRFGLRMQCRLQGNRTRAILLFPPSGHHERYDSEFPPQTASLEKSAAQTPVPLYKCAEWESPMVRSLQGSPTLLPVRDGVHRDDLRPLQLCLRETPI